MASKKGKKNKKASGPLGFDQGALKAAKRRALATKAYYSSQLEELRQESLSQGAIPYKILSYRRVVNPESIPFPILPDSYVLPDTFETHLKYISRHCYPLGLRELITALETDTPIPDKAVVVTIDGGHMDTYLHAFPLLLKYQIPATIFLSSGYIESGAFLYDDRILMLLLIFREAEINMPKFEFLPEEVYQLFEQQSPDKSITLEGISTMIQALKSCSQEQRAIAVGRLAEIALEILQLPEFEDFMRWKDVQHMQQMGFSFGSMGHFAWGHPTISPLELADDFGHSLKQLQEKHIEPLPAYCFAPEKLSAPLIDALGQINCRWALASTIFPEPRYQTQIPMILGRTAIFEANSFCTEIFACRLWGVKISGVQF